MKKCLYCENIYANELAVCPNCQRVSHKILKNEQAAKSGSPYTPYVEQKKAQPYKPYNVQQLQEEISDIIIDEEKIPKIKNPNPALIFGIIAFIFLALITLCFII